MAAKFNSNGADKQINLAFTLWTLLCSGLCNDYTHVDESKLCWPNAQKECHVQGFCRHELQYMALPAPEFCRPNPVGV